MKNKKIIIVLTLFLIIGLTGQCAASPINTPFDLLAEITTGTIDNLVNIFNKSADYFKQVVRKFADMGNHWADEVVGMLTEVGAIGGYADGTFKPDNPITRAEFSKILTVSLGLEKIEGSAFDDTTTHWAKNDINTLVHHKIIDKAEYGNTYEPDKKITRVEIAKMVVRAIGKNNEAIAKAGQNTGFNDNSSIKPSDRGYVIIAKENKLVGGYPDNTFKPNANATRAEASAMIVRTLNVLTNPKDKEEIPKEEKYTSVDKLPKKTFEEKNIDKDVKESMSLDKPEFDLKYEPGEIVEADKDLLPLKYGNMVIKNYEYIPYEESFLVGTNGYKWGMGRPFDMFVIEGELEKKQETKMYRLMLLDKNNNDVIGRDVNVTTIEPRFMNDPTEQTALKKYPHIPVEDNLFSATKDGKVQLIYLVEPEYADKAETILFFYKDIEKQKSDVIHLPKK